MASIFCTSGKEALLQELTRHNFKAALYTEEAQLNGTTERYQPEGEVPSGKGYVTGGIGLVKPKTEAMGGTVWLAWNDVTWPKASFSARYMLIYDASDANRAYAIFDFGAEKTGQGGKFVYEAAVISI
jgi:hypothetical protein